jgi:hypothetical protein
MPSRAQKSRDILVDDVFIALALLAGRMEAQRAISRLDQPIYRRPRRKKESLPPLVVRSVEIISSTVRTEDEEGGR